MAENIKFLGKTTNIKSIDKDKCSCITPLGRCLPDCASFDQDVFDRYDLKVGSWPWALIKMCEGEKISLKGAEDEFYLYMDCSGEVRNVDIEGDNSYFGITDSGNGLWTINKTPKEYPKKWK